MLWSVMPSFWAVLLLRNAKYLNEHYTGLYCILNFCVRISTKTSYFITLSFPLKLEYELLSNFNVLYLKVLLRLPVLNFFTAYLVYLENLITFLAKS
jgi:hypothetical protein